MRNQNIAIFDCAIKRPSLFCFNRLVNHFKLPFTYHSPPHQGLSSLEEDSNARAYIIFGSASNVEDRLPWQRDLALFVDQKLQEGIPVLGLCFGHQLMADFYGLEVRRNPQEVSLKGVREISLLEDTWGFKKEEKLGLFKAHSFQVTGDSKNLLKLGTSEECTWDAIYHKNLPFLGFQTHPEASLDFYEHEIKEYTGDLEADLIKRATSDGLSVLERFLKASQEN